MKTWTVIRFILAAIIATLGCVGLFMNFSGFGVLFGVPALLLAKSSEFTKPIPRNELLWLLVFFIGLIVLNVGANYLNLHLPQPQGVIRLVFTAAMWILWMFAICYRWQKEKKNADI
jgi:hypothetical protein